MTQAFFRALANEYGTEGEVNLAVRMFEKMAQTTIAPPESNAAA
jgi:hypothetical protein